MHILVSGGLKILRVIGGIVKKRIPIDVLVDRRFSTTALTIKQGAKGFTCSVLLEKKKKIAGVRLDFES
jgi:hypothetical protein